MEKPRPSQRHHLLGVFALALISIWTTAPTSSAQSFTTVKAPGGIYADRIQGYAKGDSLVMIYSYRQRDEEMFETLVVTSGHSISQLSIPLLHGRLLLGAFDTPYNIFFYVLHTKEKKDLVVRAIVYDKRNHRASIADWEADIPDHVIGIVSQNDLTIVGADEPGNAIDIVTIARLTVKRQERYTVDPDISLKKSRQFGFVADTRPVATADAAAPKKIFFTQKALFIAEATIGAENGSLKIIRFDRTTGRKSRKMIFEPSGRRFGYFIHDEQFYHVIKNPGVGFDVNIYDSVKIISSFKADTQHDYIKSTAWLRNEVDLRVLKRTVLHVIDGRGEPYVIIHAGDSAHPIMELGMHQTGKKQDMGLLIAGGVIGGVAGALSPALGLMARSATLAGSLAADPDVGSIDKYFYLQKDDQNGFVYREKTGLVKQQIDEHDASDPKIKLWDKVYMGDDNNTYGIYRLKGENDQIRITRFQKQRMP